jgi:hypothetical protein
MSSSKISYARLPTNMGRFASLLSNYPKLEPYWDWGRQECDHEALTANLTTWSHGEQVVARFFLAVWFGENSVAQFDLIEAAGVLDVPDRQMIVAWFSAPFFP